MNKNILWGSLAVVVVVLFVWWVSSANAPSQTAVVDSTKETNTNTTAVKTTQPSKPVSVAPTETFTNLLPKLGNYQCDYEEVTQTTRSSNTVYLSDGKMRAEFRSRTATAGTNSIMVYDGVNLYSWTEGMSTGSVIHPKSLSDFPAIIPRDIVAAKVLGSGLFSASWNCHAWSRDPSLLVKPSYLKV